MRLQFDRPSAGQRAALERRFAQMREPDGALDVLRRHLPEDVRAMHGERSVRTVCTPMAHPPDRFVMRVDVETEVGTRATYALKVYADARGEHIAAAYDALAACWTTEGAASISVCLPLIYVPDEYLFISLWTHGPSLWSSITAGDSALVEHAATHAASTLAQLHQVGRDLALEPETGAAHIVESTLERCERLRVRWPQDAGTVRPLMTGLQAALPLLAPVQPTLVHGDPGPGNFLWDGERWLLLDLDMYGHADPAYDVGYLLAQVLRRCLENPPLDRQASALMATLRQAYLVAMPEVAARNITFYYALTLIRKLYTVRKQQADRWQEIFGALTRHADIALREILGEAQA